MTKNMGSADRALRVVGALILGFFILNGTLEGALGVIAGIIAIVLLLTSVVSVCPLYTVLKVSTLGKAAQKK